MTAALRVGVIDYGAGNLFNMLAAWQAVGAQAAAVDSPNGLEQVDLLVLPGVGAWAPAVRTLHETGLAGAIREWVSAGRPLLGICLGMQLLYESSEEGPGQGLGLLPGRVRGLGELQRQGGVATRERGRIPHMGWDDVYWAGERGEGPRLASENSLAQVLLSRSSPEPFYFAHSYGIAASQQTTAAVIACTSRQDGYGGLVVGVSADSITGFQFHPEKSGSAGLALLRTLRSRCEQMTAGQREVG